MKIAEGLSPILIPPLSVCCEPRHRFRWTSTLCQDDHSYVLVKLPGVIKQLRGLQRSFCTLNLTYLMLVWSNEIQLAT